MLDEVLDAVCAELTRRGVNTVREYPDTELCDSESKVCVSLKSARITSAGCGGYIGKITDDDMVLEAYGSKAELDISLDIYSPQADMEAFRGTVYNAFVGVPSLSIRGFEAGDSVYDKASGMFCSKNTAHCLACLVTGTANLFPVYTLEEEWQ